MSEWVSDSVWSICLCGGQCVNVCVCVSGSEWLVVLEWQCVYVFVSASPTLCSKHIHSCPPISVSREPLRSIFAKNNNGLSRSQLNPPHHASPLILYYIIILYYYIVSSADQCPQRVDAAQEWRCWEGVQRTPANGKSVDGAHKRSVGHFPFFFQFLCELIYGRLR